MKGLLENEKNTMGTVSKGMTGLLGNPFFGMGMNLLASKYNPQINPFQGAMSGLANAQKYQQSQAEQKRREDMRNQLQQFFLRNQGGTPFNQGMPQAPRGMLPPSILRGAFQKADMNDPMAYIDELSWKMINGGQ